MQIQVHADHHIPGNKELIPQAEAMAEDSLERFSKRITTLLIHFTDENSSSKAGDNDKRCVIEARAAGINPISVAHQAPEPMQALDGAMDKLIRTLDKTLSRLEDPRAHIRVAVIEEDEV